MPVEASHYKSRFVNRRNWFQDKGDTVVCAAENVLEQQCDCTIEIAPICSGEM